MTTQNRQAIIPGMAKDTRKSVSVPSATSCHATVPQTGILINANWKVSADSMNIILYRRDKESKTGKERWRAEGFYSTLGSALVGLVRQGIRDTELSSIRAVNQKIEELERDILKMAARR